MDFSSLTIIYVVYLWIPRLVPKSARHKNTEIMCLAFFHFLLFKWKNKYWDLHHIYIFIKIKLGATKPVCTSFTRGCQDDRENNKSNITPTSLTGKSLKATWGARWCCLCHSQSVTDKHHAGSINRLIALSLLPLQCTQSGRLVGVFVKIIDKILSISETNSGV